MGIQEPLPHLVRVAQARQILGNISPTTLARWARERADFPKSTQIGPKVRVFKLDELVAWRDKQGEAS